MIAGRLYLNGASYNQTMSGSILGIKPLTLAVLLPLTPSGARAGPLKAVDAGLYRVLEGCVHRFVIVYCIIQSMAHSPSGR